jgi:superfamily II DNA or RNA helicase
MICHKNKSLNKELITKMDNSESKKELLKKIRGIEEQVSLLNELKEKLIYKVESLSAEAEESPHNIPPKSIKDISIPRSEQSESVVLTVPQKIEIFTTMFSGRNDVYAKLWTSRKTGKSGYSPACLNEWAQNICQKPKVKCSQCSKRELLPLDNATVEKHLRGIEVIGVYPLLPDETCRFLAVDFDGSTWLEDVNAFRKTCENEGVPVAVERSRSGNGAHAWIFFEKTIAAFLARKMGTFLITRTMENRYQLDIKSYDRLFPSQDTMPKGGFGNLIALPFQKEAIKYGNSVFIDSNGVPYRDQWGYLSQQKKMSGADIDHVLENISKSGSLPGIKCSPTEQDDPPWMRLPSGKSRYKPRILDLPKKVELVIANRIYIKTENVPSVLLNQIKQFAAFQNPEFYKRQKMRLSTSVTPRVICCAEISDGYLSIPRGCLEDILGLMREYGVQVDIRDKRKNGKKNIFDFCGTLSSEQGIIAREILKHETGVLVLPPGSGKTVLAIYAISKRKRNTLILVHRKPLMEQWRLQLALFLGMDVKDIGQIGGGKSKVTDIVDVAMIQSLGKKGIVADIVENYGFIIVDECHHLGAVSFERILSQVKAKYILGLTATPYRLDGHQPIIHMQCGPICFEKKKTHDISENLRYEVFPRITDFSFSWSEESNIYEVWPPLVRDKKRNELILMDILNVVERGRFPIVLTERREHLEILQDMLRGSVQHLAVLHGGLRAKKRKEVLSSLKECGDNKKKLLLATGAYIGEGFDDPRLDTLFITMPVSFKGKMVQYAGRLHRSHENKKDVRIYDYVDHNVSVLLRMFEKRFKTYKMMGYNIKEDPEAL